jgi:hypothetical protein
MYSLDDIKIPNVFSAPHQGDDVRRATDGITNATMYRNFIVEKVIKSN